MFRLIYYYFKKQSVFKTFEVDQLYSKIKDSRKDLKGLLITGILKSKLYMINIILLENNYL